MNERQKHFIAFITLSIPVPIQMTSIGFVWQTLLFVLAFWLVLFILGVFNIQWNFFLKAVHNGSTAQRHIALTFDDGPHPVYTPQVLALLNAYSIKATFFCIGKRVVQHPELIKGIHHHGHILANHSFTHASTIDFHSKAKWLAEIRQTDTAIVQAVGLMPKFFRPPYGVTTPHLARAVRESGHVVIGWRVRPYDTLNRAPKDIVNTILRKTAPGDIILLHDTHDRIVPILEQLLPELKKRRFTMTTVEKLIQHDAYVQT